MKNYCFHSTRRAFLASATAALMAPSAASAFAAANDRIQIGVIGLGSRGFNLLDDFLKHRSARIVALCDVDHLHYRDNAWGKGRAFGRKAAADYVQKAYVKQGSPMSALFQCNDYRELIDRKDVDAVVIATPDHWHALCTLDALNAGKDVYCEKPVTHLFAEGQAVVQAVARNKCVFQTGSQQRSDPLFRRVVELTRNGIPGDVQTIEVGLPPGYDKPQGDTTVQHPRADLDYEMWCGPSPVLPLMQARHHRWWRGHRAYGGGVLMDWIGHHNDIAHWAMGVDRAGPVTVEATGWTFPETDVYNTPHEYTIRCAYANGVHSTISTHNRQGLKIIGTKGWVWVNRGRIEASDATWLEPGFSPGAVKVTVSDDHVGNFLDCIRTRSECIAPADAGHRSITPGHLAYVSNHLKRKLAWDPVAEVCPDDAEATELLKATDYREPWRLA